LAVFLIETPLPLSLLSLSEFRSTLACCAKIGDLSPLTTSYVTPSAIRLVTDLSNCGLRSLGFGETFPGLAPSLSCRLLFFLGDCLGAFLDLSLISGNLLDWCLASSAFPLAFRVGGEDYSSFCFSSINNTPRLINSYIKPVSTDSRLGQRQDSSSVALSPWWFRQCRPTYW
jgi:hypothetical protein